MAKDVGEIGIEGDEHTVLGEAGRGDAVVVGRGDALVVDRIGLMPGVSEEGGHLDRQVLVHLEAHASAGARQIDDPIAREVGCVGDRGPDVLDRE